MDCDYLRGKDVKKTYQEKRGNGGNACCFEERYQQRTDCKACYSISSAANLIALLTLIKIYVYLLVTKARDISLKTIQKLLA